MKPLHLLLPALAALVACGCSQSDFASDVTQTSPVLQLQPASFLQDTSEDSPSDLAPAPTGDEKRAQPGTKKPGTKKPAALKKKSTGCSAAKPAAAVRYEAKLVSIKNSKSKDGQPSTSYVTFQIPGMESCADKTAIKKTLETQTGVIAVELHCNRNAVVHVRTGQFKPQAALIALQGKSTLKVNRKKPFDVTKTTAIPHHSKKIK